MISRRFFIGALVAAPAVIRLPRLLMPVRAEIIKPSLPGFFTPQDESTILGSFPGVEVGDAVTFGEGPWDGTVITAITTSQMTISRGPTSAVTGSGWLRLA